MTEKRITGVALRSAIPGRPINVTSIGIEKGGVYNKQPTLPSMERDVAGVLITWAAVGTQPALKLLVPFSNIAAIVYAED